MTACRCGHLADVHGDDEGLDGARWDTLAQVHQDPEVELVVVAKPCGECGCPDLRI